MSEKAIGTVEFDLTFKQQLDLRIALGQCVFCGDPNPTLEAKSTGKKVCQTCFDARSNLVPRRNRRKAQMKQNKVKKLW